MPSFHRVVAACLLGTLVALPLHAESDGRAMESSWLELVKGYRGDAMGVQLMEIEKNEEDASQTIMVTIPKDKMGHPDEIEEVVVVGKMPEKNESKPLINYTYEWVRDYDNDNHGLIIRLGDGNLWPIRLYMNSEPGFTE